MTLRELVWMVGGKREHDWGIASSAMALLANCHRDPKRSAAFRPEDFNPCIERKPETVVKVPLTVLRDIFVTPQRVPATNGRNGSNQGR